MDGCNEGCMGVQSKLNTFVIFRVTYRIAQFSKLSKKKKE